jgi:hypothetical protein
MTGVSVVASAAAQRKTVRAAPQVRIPKPVHMLKQRSGRPDVTIPMVRQTRLRRSQTGSMANSSGRGVCNRALNLTRASQAIPSETTEAHPRNVEPVNRSSPQSDTARSSVKQRSQKVYHGVNAQRSGNTSRSRLIVPFEKSLTSLAVSHE